MSAFCFFNILEVKDPERLEAYRSCVGETVANHGGRYRLIGGQTLVKEGNWCPVFPVLIEFSDLASAEAWYHSPEYRELLELRLSATRSEAVFMETEGLGT